MSSRIDTPRNIRDMTGRRWQELARAEEDRRKEEAERLAVLDMEAFRKSRERDDTVYCTCRVCHGRPKQDDCEWATHPLIDSNGSTVAREQKR